MNMIETTHGSCDGYWTRDCHGNVKYVTNDETTQKEKGIHRPTSEAELYEHQI